MDGLPKYNNSNVVTKQISRPETKIKHKTVKNVKMVKPKWDTVDFMMVGAAVLTVIVMAFLVIFMANKSATANTQLSTTSAKLETVRNKNNDLKQEVSDLSSPDRLNKIAEKNGLKLNNQNIRNVK
ncbi:cell division protein FtsL [Weissella paramesenteroides]|uniref:cell division protein FtsL n=1 Tax=Weissella paramesenteroides TaxID=1249 RepID=UPI00123C1EAE|nr:cell division protein FtsL [Weissella paramesenteroides]KAA8439060.1 cell division protein FtsL [Weissella paramesenteroides]KAA8440232.1 cell division protein FtsL [Weissella paramesenteroides]KAA8443857.1 cell division protein FtsL [Weissella paramesenteroides]KAA8448918.1 cell division protein FtsL [Weissella paramesenteroides]KAA8451408.1 cell division protein FtsL [Weissella paramesenteroides]